MADLQFQPTRGDKTRVWWRTIKGKQWVFSNVGLTDTDRLCGYYLVPTELVSELKEEFKRNELDVD